MALTKDPYSGRPQFELRLTATETAVYTSTNKSRVSWSLVARVVTGGWESYNLNGGPWSVTIAGSVVASGNKALDFRNHDVVGYEIAIANGVEYIDHNADGERTISFRASHNAGSPFNTASTSNGSLSLTSINRVPGAPGAPTFDNITSSSGRVLWAASTVNGGNDIDHYVLQVGTTSGGSNIFNGTASSPKTISGLSKYTTYYARVKAVADNGDNSAWSPNRSFRTLATAPVIGTSHTATSITRNSAVITGFSVTDTGGQAPTDVRVQYNTSASDTDASVVTRGAWADTALPGLTALTEYFYRAAAANSAGWGSYGAWKSFETLDAAPDDMAAPTFSSVTDTSFRINWTAPNMNGATFSAYRYEVCLDDTFGTLLKSGTTTDLYADITGLLPGTLYFCRVRANATPYNGGYGDSSQLTTGIAPNSGLRSYLAIGGTLHQGTLYLAINGQLKVVKPMYAHDGVLETE